jgi:choline dehydrogenase-like flavoprotein
LKTYKTKFCIIGSGIAGCLCAKFLAEGGQEVLIVERGAAVTHDQRLKTRKHEDATLASEHLDIVSEGLKGHRFQYVYALGGTTNHWAGQAPRMHPNDFRLRSLYGVMEDWPISYDELEHYYCVAEQELALAGPISGPMPRSQPYPQPPHPLSPADQLFARCFPKESIVAVPQARPTLPVGNRPPCCGTATCFLCPIDSKYTPLNTHIPQLRQMKNIQIVTDTVALSFESTRSKAKCLQAIHTNGEEVKIFADFFIVAANALENAAIILRSNNLVHRPFTGRYLFDHSVWGLSVIIAEEGYPFYGNSLFTGHCYYFYDGSFRAERAGALGEIMNIGGLRISELTRQKVAQGMRGAKLRDEVERQFRHHIAISFLLEDIPNPERCIRISNQRNRLGVPVTDIHYPPTSSYVRKTIEFIEKEMKQLMQPLRPKSFISGALVESAGHILGTCRMGNDDKAVVDSQLRYKNADNIFLLGGSAFPTFSPSNPTLTIAALAVRLGEFLKHA